MDNSAVSINAYPSPFSDNITIEFKLEKDRDIDISLIDLQGRSIDSYPLVRANAGLYIKEIKTKNINSGTYIIAGHIDGHSFYQKVVCIH